MILAAFYRSSGAAPVLAVILMTEEERDVWMRAQAVHESRSG
jgi:hypothetical protein